MSDATGVTAAKSRRHALSLTLFLGVLGLHLVAILLLANMRLSDPEALHPPEPPNMAMVDLPPVPLAASEGSQSTPGFGRTLSGDSPAPESGGPESGRPKKTAEPPARQPRIAATKPNTQPTEPMKKASSPSPSRLPNRESPAPAVGMAERPVPTQSVDAGHPNVAKDGSSEVQSAMRRGGAPASAEPSEAGRNPPSKIAHAPAVSAAGSGDSPARFGAGYLNNPAPKYPPIARRMGEEGKVLLRVLVNAEGLAKSVLLSHSSGFEMLDNSALKAVQQWRFIPARRGGDPVEAWVQVPIFFKLE